MGRPIKKTETNSGPIDIGYSSGYGGTIGQPYAQSSVYTISTAYATDAGVDVAQGYINQQRSKDKFVMMDATSVGTKTTVVTLVDSTDGNVANLAAGTGTVLCYNTSNVAFYAKYITAKHVTDWNGNKYVYKVNTVATANWANVATA